MHCTLPSTLQVIVKYAMHCVVFTYIKSGLSPVPSFIWAGLNMAIMVISHFKFYHLNQALRDGEAKGCKI